MFWLETQTFTLNDGTHGLDYGFEKLGIKYVHTKTLLQFSFKVTALVYTLSI